MGEKRAVGPAAATARNVVSLVAEVFRIPVHVRRCAGRSGKAQQRKRLSAASTLFMARTGE